jgi:hypothetical protein
MDSFRWLPGWYLHLLVGKNVPVLTEKRKVKSEKFAAAIEVR